jgi:hypothetical protein
MNRRHFIRSSGWTLLGLAASGTVLGKAAGLSAPQAKSMARPMQNDLKVFLGDIHNHCNLTYGHGDMRDAFEAAKQQLDFVSVTPHAMWPDIPRLSDPSLKWVFDYHTNAFKRLRNGGYDKYLAMTKEYNKENSFVTFVSYECHSMQHGDHVVLNHDLDAPLVECTSVEDLKMKLKDKKAFVTPHHMGYQTGYRGYNWDFFTEGQQTPFVEMFSRHGLAESDFGDYPYLHDMGPKIFEGTVQYGLNKGHKFGIMGSTDQHAGYPGSYGDGRIALMAPSLTREALWEAMQNRSMYCVTGDKILVDFRINDAPMGSIIKGGQRKIYINVEAESLIDYVDIIKNGKCIARLNGPHTPVVPDGSSVRAKLRVNFGWNRVEEPVRWDGNLQISEGIIHRVTPCFRGAGFTSPQQSKLDNEADTYVTKVNKVLSASDRRTDLELYSSKNPNTTTPSYQGVILDATMPKSAKLSASFNGKHFEHSLDELLGGTQAHFMREWLSESIQFVRAVPEAGFLLEHYMTDNQAEHDTDYYYARVRQRDGQWAWSSPVWVERT